jgi:hypothetical protein
MRKHTVALTLIAFTFIAFSASSVSAQAPASPATGGSTSAIDEVRKTYPLHAGPFYVRPGLTLDELGVDTNVFNQAGERKSDFTFTVAPRADIAVPLARRGLITATVGTDLVYYAEYESERSIDPRMLVRGEAYARRVTLFVENGWLNTRQRPNFEIDLRSRHQEHELAGGIAVRVTPKFSVEVAKRLGKIRFDGDAFFLGQRLQETLDRDTDAYTMTARHKLSFLTTLGVRYERKEDRFPLSPVRDTDSFRVMPGVEFKPRALISGSAWVGYRRFDPKNPIMPAKAGLVSELALSYTLLGSTTFGVTYDRDYQYSFEALNPYFVDNSVGVFIRRALGGRFDVQASAARHAYDYERLAIQTADVAAAEARRDTTDNFGLGLGYRLKRQTRVAFGATYHTRKSTAALHVYEGLRYGTTVTYGF